MKKKSDDNKILLATCPTELQESLQEELLSLGALWTKPGYRAVEFEVTQEDFYRIHLKSAIASSIYEIIKVSAGKNETIVHNQAKRVNWPKFFSERKTYKVDGIAGDRGKDAMTSNQISKQVRLAIEKVFEIKGLPHPKVNLKEPQVVVTAYVYRGRLTLSLNTSGKALHKRGYRLEGHPAPIKETLAAAILRMAKYDGSIAFLDPMCGSGTLAIEAAFIALKKAPNIHRKKGEFAFEHLASFDKDLWRKIQDEIRAEKLDHLPHGVYASDLEQKFVDFSSKNALRARVEKYMQIKQSDFLNSTKPEDKGLLVINLPYGERIGKNNKTEFEELRSFYKEVGDTLKRGYPGWNAVLLTAEDAPWKHIGLKPSRKTSLYNGSIKTKLLFFELFEGPQKAMTLK